MDDTAARSCAHRDCSCDVEGDQRWCSSDCERAAECSPVAGQPPRCNCGHPECAGWERVTGAS